MARGQFYMKAISRGPKCVKVEEYSENSIISTESRLVKYHSWNGVLEGEYYTMMPLILREQKVWPTFHRLSPQGEVFQVTLVDSFQNDLEDGAIKTCSFQKGWIIGKTYHNRRVLQFDGCFPPWFDM